MKVFESRTLSKPYLRERTKGAQQIIFRCAPFCIGFVASLRCVWCGAPVPLTRLAASARKRLTASTRPYALSIQNHAVSQIIQLRS